MIEVNVGDTKGIDALVVRKIGLHKYTWVSPAMHPFECALWG